MPANVRRPSGARAPPPVRVCHRRRPWNPGAAILSPGVPVRAAPRAPAPPVPPVPLRRARPTGERGVLLSLPGRTPRSPVTNRGTGKISSDSRDGRDARVSRGVCAAVCRGPRLPGQVCRNSPRAAPPRACSRLRARGCVTNRERGLDHQRACGAGRTAGGFSQDRSSPQSAALIYSRPHHRGRERPRRPAPAVRTATATPGRARAGRGPGSRSP